MCMRRSGLAWLLVALVVATILAGCVPLTPEQLGAGEPAAAQPATAEQQILGRWVASESRVVEVTFNDDGTFQYAHPASKSVGTYRIEGTQLHLATGDTSGSVEFELSDEHLVLRSSGPLAQYFKGAWVRP